MKKSHKKILIFNIIVIMILFINSFSFNVLSGIKMPLFIAFLLIIFKLLFGFEKDRHRYIKDLLLEVIMFLIMFFILYYLLGIMITFARTDGYMNFHGIKTLIIPTILNVVLIEIFRYMIMTKSEGSRLASISSVIMLIALSISNAVYFQTLDSKYTIFIFLALTVLPAISSNIVFSIMTLKVGYKPILLYALVINLYQYFLPIVPNPSEYLASIINFVLPVLFGYRVYKFFQKEQQHDKEVERDYQKQKFVSLLFPLFITVFLVYFTSGYFKYWAVAIMSGSMEPTILKGDAVVIEKVDKDYKSIKKGQTIAYKYNDVIIVHRVVKRIKDDNHYIFYTKGDANKRKDDIPITEDMVVGKVNVRIPFIGIPVVWFNTI